MCLLLSVLQMQSTHQAVGETEATDNVPLVTISNIFFLNVHYYVLGKERKIFIELYLMPKLFVFMNE